MMNPPPMCAKTMPDSGPGTDQEMLWCSSMLFYYPIYPKLYSFPLWSFSDGNNLHYIETGEFFIVHEYANCDITEQLNI